jgi:tetratricopeptide (TPR) repeat protein
MTDQPSDREARRAREAEGYYELGLFEDALARAKELVGSSHEGTVRFALVMQAECLRSLERWVEGATAFERLIAADPENVAAYVGLGWCRKREGRLDLATRSMERLLAEKPEEGIGLFNLACYLALAGERERPLELLRSAIRVEESFRALAREEEDFASLAGDPRFLEIVEMEEEP